MVPKLLIEFIGTFFLVLVVGLSGNPLAVGATLVALVYLGAYISGAQYNPAVSIGLWLRRAQDGRTTWRYILVQMIAAVIAALAVWAMHGEPMTVSPAQSVSLSVAMLAEVLFTFLLVSVIFHVAATKSNKGNQYYGLAIGLVVMGGAIAVGPISGAAFNPAVGIGPILADFSTISRHTTELWLYLVAPLAGAGLAAAIYRFTNPKE